MAFLALAGAAEYAAELAYAFELEAAASEAAAVAAQTVQNVELGTGLGAAGVSTLVSGGKLVYDKLMGKRKNDGGTWSRRQRTRTSGSKRVYGVLLSVLLRKLKKVVDEGSIMASSEI